MIGDRVKELRKLQGMTQKDLAEKLGLKSQTTIAAIENNKNNPSNELLVKLADFFDVSTDYLLGKETPVLPSDAIPVVTTEFSNIPIVGVVRAGLPILATENIEGYITLPSSMMNKSKEYFALRIKGDSMNLEFQEGSIIVVEKTNILDNGEIGVVLIDGSESTVKKVVQNKNMITLIPMSNNSIHIPTMYDLSKDEVHIVGRVKHAIKSY
jgi:repressor LexA